MAELFGRILIGIFFVLPAGLGAIYLWHRLTGKEFKIENIKSWQIEFIGTLLLFIAILIFIYS